MSAPILDGVEGGESIAAIAERKLEHATVNALEWKISGRGANLKQTV